jgi:amino-acid N-acetyltransferase
VLGSSATKREAKSYLQRFTPAEGASPKTLQPKHGVNLGAFYGTARAVEESPRFVQRPTDAVVAKDLNGPLHIALVKIRIPQYISDETLDGVGRTLSQLGKLGLTSAVVVDCDDHIGGIQSEDWRTIATRQANRIVAAIDAYGEPGARNVDNIIGVSEKSTDAVISTAYVRGRTYIMYRKLLLTPLRKGMIPVITPIGYAAESLQAVPVKADDVILALTQELAGFHAERFPDEDPMVVSDRLKALRDEVSLDRLIILDPLGGIPTAERPNGYHLFLNLEQEFGHVKQSLLAPCRVETTSKDSAASNQASDIALCNPFTKFVESELQPPWPSTPLATNAPHLHHTRENTLSNNLIHLQNLELARRALALLPPSSSALLTTPEEAANSGKYTDVPFTVSGVGTRRQRNPLIHNLLTDKPVYSSSLPTGRLVPNAKADERLVASAHIPPTTFVKRGMPVTIFPDPRTHPLKPCVPGKTPLKLTDTTIDLSRLVYLINNSFNRRLDVEDYLKRVNNRIACVIIAGEYEGGALLTWETPPGVPDDGSEKSQARMVPYLDKFAVLQRSQGAGGVADIVFKAMVKDCFPDGVCWRSRRDNPVNKWYFERSRGTWKLPGTNWTMFWTSPDASIGQQKFSDYKGVCSSISPSWADNKAVLD